MTVRRVKIFDTTLRDGEQAPGCSMNLQEKVQLARQLERLGVDVIEAGFAASSQGDFEAIQAIAGALERTTVLSLARCNKKDIDRAYEALKDAARPKVHVFLATSPIHLEYKLEMTEDQAYERAVKAVAYARTLFDEVEFSAEDASRTDMDFLVRVFEGVIEAGATTVNAPDTVGYTTPDEHYKFVKTLKDRVRGIDGVDLSVHCHDDLGLGVANSLAAVMAGADQVECTVNGIGERAGNAAMEEIVMAIETRKDIYKAETGIQTQEIMRTSRLLSAIIGTEPSPNKAIVGKNAFAHESGVHQHGMLKNRETYEIMTPESVGWKKTDLVLGKHSGKHALADKFKELGYEVTPEELDRLFIKFKDLADEKKDIYDEDIQALVVGEYASIDEGYEFIDYQAFTSEGKESKVVIRLAQDGEEIEQVGSGKGPIDAAFACMAKISGMEVALKDFSIQAVTQGKDALGQTRVRLEKDGRTVLGKGVSNDIIKSSIQAYLNGINRMIALDRMEEENATRLKDAI